MMIQIIIMLNENGPVNIILSKFGFIQKIKLRAVCKTWKRILEQQIEPIVKLKNHIMKCIEIYTSLNNEAEREVQRSLVKNLTPRFLRLPLPDEVFAYVWALNLSPGIKNIYRAPEAIERDFEM